MNCKYPEIGLLEISDVTTGNSNTVDAVDDGKYPFYDRSRTIKRSNKYLFDEEAIIIPGEGQEFIPKYIKGKFDLHQRAYAVFPKECVIGKYLYYAIMYKKAHFAQIAVGSTVKSLRLDSFKILNVPYPDVHIQKKIADFLSILDELIEKNNAINDYLLQISRELFKNSFSYSVDDELPLGWSVSTVGDIVEIHDSKRIPLPGNIRDKMEKIYPYYGAASLMDYVDDYIFDGRYVLLGEDGTVVRDDGSPVIQYVYGKFWVNNHAHVLTGKKGISTELLMMLLEQLDISKVVTGAVQAKVSQSNLKSIRVVLPSDKTIDVLNKKLKPLFDQYRNAEDCNKLLIPIRDVLLSKMMSGGIDSSKLNLSI